jgi:hypothetical protein
MRRGFLGAICPNTVPGDLETEVFRAARVLLHQAIGDLAVKRSP